MIKTAVYFFALFFSLAIRAQTPNQVFTMREMYEQIFRHHPLVKQAQSLSSLAKQELRMARGGFDPKLALDFDRKEFDKKEYYQLFYTKVKAPIWVGELQASFERNQGYYLNPRRSYTPFWTFSRRRGRSYWAQHFDR